MEDAQDVDVVLVLEVEDQVGELLDRTCSQPRQVELDGVAGGGDPRLSGDAAEGLFDRVDDRRAVAASTSPA